MLNFNKKELTLDQMGGKNHRDLYKNLVVVATSISASSFRLNWEIAKV